MKPDIFSIIGLVLAVFFYMGWHFAEADNDILRQELAAQSHSQSAHFEGK